MRSLWQRVNEFVSKVFGYEWRNYYSSKYYSPGLWWCRPLKNESIHTLCLKGCTLTDETFCVLRVGVGIENRFWSILSQSYTFNVIDSFQRSFHWPPPVTWRCVASCQVTLRYDGTLQCSSPSAGTDHGRRRRNPRLRFRERDKITALFNQRDGIISRRGANTSNTQTSVHSERN